MLKLFGLLLLVSVSNCQVWNQNTVFANYAALGPNVYLQWNITSQDIFFKLVAVTDGWVGFGLSANGKMPNSDTILAWTSPLDGSIQFRDSHTDPVKYNVYFDTVAHWRPLFYTRFNGCTTVIFTRKLVVIPPPGQPVQEINFNIGLTDYVIWAYGTRFGNNLPTWHGTTKGSNFLRFINPIPTIPPVTFPPVTFPPVTVPPVTVPPVTVPPVIIYNENTVFANLVDLDPNYRLQWNFTTDDLVIRITARTTGWVGFGLSPTGRMSNSNMLVTWMVPSSRTIEFRDASAVNYGLIYDRTTNWRHLFYGQVNGVTTVIATRKNRIPASMSGINNVDVTSLSNVVYAWGTGFGLSGLPTYHFSQRGSRTVGLLTGRH